MKLKTLTGLLILTVCTGFLNPAKAQTYIKGNLPLAAVLIPNVAVETRLNDQWSFQVSVTASFWKSINGGPQEFFFIIPEARYHFDTLDHGFFVGANVGAANFKMQKYNYWNTDKYQVGYAYLGGFSAGYTFKLNDKWGLEAFLGGGFIGSYYRGFLLSTGERYDSSQTVDRHFDISGDWLPYEGGLMLVYKL